VLYSNTRRWVFLVSASFNNLDEKMQPTPIDSLTDTELEEGIKYQPPIALVGSGISIWSPTSLPTGRAFSEGTFNALFLNEAGTLNDPLGEHLRELFKDIPFESIMEKCPEPETLVSIIREIYNVHQPNNIHRVLAQGVLDNHLHSIITTNYDCCIDQALDDIQACNPGSENSLVNKIVRQEDVLETLEGRKLYFKIHGSTADPTGQTLVFRMRHESALPPWKRTVMKTLVSNRPLLIVGYSGLDFEICPEIPLMHPSYVIWNFRLEEEITTNARRVMNQVPGRIVIGDMRKLLSRVLQSIDAEIGAPSVDVEKVLRQGFSPSTRILWRASLLNSMSYAKAAVTLTSQLLKTDISNNFSKVTLIEEHARSLHCSGAYKSAALEYERAYLIAKLMNLPKSKLCRLLLDACDNWRCYGSFIRAFQSLHKAKRIALTIDVEREELLAVAELKKILLLRHPYQIAVLLRQNWIARWLRNKAEVSIINAAKTLPLSGSWYDYQQLGLWTERFNLPIDVLKQPGLYEPPPPREGYKHLGYLIPQMIVFRDEVESARRTIDEETLAEANRLLELAINLGINPEAWKISYLLMRKFRGTRNKTSLKMFLRYFRACEYFAPMRIILMLPKIT
jgi:hypothetical protein